MAYKIAGVTRDNTGNLIGSCDVFLFKLTGNVFTQVAHTTSDASTGQFIFSGIADNDPSYNIVAFKNGSPDIFDVSDRNLTPLTEMSDYQGLGDVLAGAAAYYGIRAYNAAYAAPGNNPAMDLSNFTGAVTMTANILSTGLIDVAGIQAWITANGLSDVRITKLYDHTGNGRHFNQPSAGNAPALIMNNWNSTFPTIQFTTDFTCYMAISNLASAIAQPFSISCVVNPVSSGSQWGMFGSTTGPGAAAEWASGSGIRIWAGAPNSGYAAMTGDTMHAVQFLYNGGSSKINVDGTETVVGTGGGSFATDSTLGAWSGYEGFNGRYMDFAIWAGDQSSNFGSFHTNQSAKYGTP